MRYFDSPDADSGFAVRDDAQGTTRTVSVSGELDLHGAGQLRRALDEALADAPETLVLDLSALSFVDSSGLSVVVAAHRHAMAASVRLVIIEGGPAVRRAFEVTGLQETLPLAVRPDPTQRSAA